MTLMRKNFDIAALRDKLANKTGKKYWKSLEEVAETEQFQDLLKHEFPAGADQWLNPVTRRNFLRLMGASLALGGLGACSARPPQEQITPYVRGPEGLVPGEAMYYATSMQLGGIATGLLAESHMGRPTKVDGNPDHVGSSGATDIYAQASILSLYDPDRLTTIRNVGITTTWANFVNNLTARMELAASKNGAGLRILTETITSPLLGSMLTELLTQYPEAEWHQYEPINRNNARVGSMLAFGEVDVNTVYDFSQANVVVSLDSNFTGPGPIGVRYARDFVAGRKVMVAGDDTSNVAMNRLYQIETTPTVTGAIADHRLALDPTHIEAFAYALANTLGLDVPAPSADMHVPAEWVTAVADDLQANAGASIVIVGESQSPAVHAIAHAINDRLGNVGTTVRYTAPLEVSPVNHLESLSTLVDAMNAGAVDTLIMIGTNPVYNSPADIDFLAALENVPFRAKMSLYEDETAFQCQWAIPMTHYLEHWGDGRAYDGTITLQQPLIDPFYDAHSPYELIGAMLGNAASTYDMLYEYWSQQGFTASPQFDDFWKRVVHDGFIAETSLPDFAVSLSLGEIPAPAASHGDDDAAPMTLIFRPDPNLWDGQFANNGWLQELPKPISKITWDNPVLVSPATAERMGVAAESYIRLTYKGRSINAPVWISPGQADNTMVISLGYGRTRAGRVGDGVGDSTYAIRTSDNPWYEVVESYSPLESGPDAELTTQPWGDNYRIASTQDHYNFAGYDMQNRGLSRMGTLQQFQEDPEFVKHMVHEIPFETLFEGVWEYNSYKWGMVVDLNSCNGCNACVIACQSENNIPIVGKDEVLNGREMQWMRIDGYFEGELDNPQLLQQPIMCQHCEQAPCELVCPVNATVHDSEGLNLMVYNRCVGTRYCSNNCPYKVRRFNFFSYADYLQGDELIPLQEIEKAPRNPDVTIRTRGVMEKCTFCVQRISEARINAKTDGDRRIQDGEVVTACQQACPTQAIYFGDLNDPNSDVARMQSKENSMEGIAGNPLNYGILTDLGTVPRTTYLARLRNVNPALENPIPADSHGHGGDAMHGEEESHEEETPEEPVTE